MIVYYIYAISFVKKGLNEDNLHASIHKGKALLL